MFSKSSAWAPFGNGSGKMETKKIKEIVHGLFVVNFCAFVNCYLFYICKFDFLCTNLKTIFREFQGLCQRISVSRG